MSALSQPVRLLILSLYVAGLFVASKLALGTWVPPTSEKGLWFYSGLAAILLGSLLVTPFYTKPADAISYAVAALVALLSVRIWGSHDYGNLAQWLWLGSVLYVALVLFAGALAITLKDSRQAALQRISASLTLLAEAIGAPRLLFSVLFIFALLAFHLRSAREYVVIALAWPVLVALRPLEVTANALQRLKKIWSSSLVGEVIGEVVGHETPNIVLVRQYPLAECSFGDLLAVPGDDGRLGLAMALDHFGFAEGRWLRNLHLHLSESESSALDSGSFFQGRDQSVAVKIPRALAEGEIRDPVWTNRQRLVGVVAPETDISRLWVELVRTDLDLAEGRLLEVQIGAHGVLYQIINGLTKEEIVQQKNTRGFVRANARKIGYWDALKLRFEVIRWLPLPNAPVFVLQITEPKPQPEAIGYVPGTGYPITMDVKPLVTHNTAILGILGAGKTYLALELVERILAQKVKVLCLDLTNQYASQLSAYYDAAKEKTGLDELRAVGPRGKGNFKENVEEGGSVVEFRAKLRELTQDFLRPNQPTLLKIYNPAEFEVWQQERGLYAGRAPMATLTPAEMTRLLSEVTLEVLQDQGMSEEPRCCLVLEEAHSLIPEWSAVATEGDKAATNGTAKAILQGRKYGLGCIVVTQRTANVTKSILNQCNTIFALRVFDATGMEFLRNYIGEDYAGVLSTLEDRHAVLFGRASSCRDPVIIRLNDRSAFLGCFRAAGNAAAQGEFSQ